MLKQSKEILERFITIFNLELPESILNKIIVLFADKNTNNWNIENLSYCFENGTIGCPFYKGYYYIPGFSRYVINIDGNLLVVKSGFNKKWTKTLGSRKKNILGGYMVSHGICDEGVRRGISRHRALCLALRHPGIYTGHLVVNHKNGIPGYDLLDNLEFCTPGDNIQHAYDNNLYPNKLTPVSILNWRTGENHEFISVTKCIEFLNKTEGFAYGRLRAGNNKKHFDGWRIKHKEDIWHTLDDHIGETSSNVSLIGKDIFTNDIIVFGSISETARLTNCDQGAIKAHIASDSNLPLRGWLFKRLEDFEGWPKYSQRHLEIFKENPTRPCDGIEVFDCEKNEILFFTSSKKAGEYFDLSPITANKLARYNQTRQKRYKFKLFKVRENLYGPSVE